MSMGLCPTRASRKREPRYNKVEETTHKYFRLWRPLNTSNGSAFSKFSCKYLQKETFTYKQTLESEDVKALLSNTTQYGLRSLKSTGPRL